MVDSGDMAESPKLLEFTVKAFRRVMEQGKHTYEELKEIIEKVELDDELLGPLKNKIHERKELMAQDVVRKQRKRFLLLEEKVAEMQQNLSEKNAAIMNYKKLMKLIHNELESQEKESDTLDISQKHLYYYIWASEYFLLTAITKFLIHQTKSDYRHNDSGFEFHNIKTLDFVRIKTTVHEF